jgi:hypothetical protein
MLHNINCYLGRFGQAIGAIFSGYSLPLKMELVLVDCSETSVTNYQLILRDSSEEQRYT